MPDPNQPDPSVNPAPATGAAAAEAAPKVARNMHDALLGLQQLLGQLDIPETMEIRDIAGTVHHLRAVLPAKAQMRLVRLLQELAAEERPDMAAFFGNLRGGVNPRETMAMAFNLALDERVMRVLNSSFEMAHGPALIRAREATGQPAGAPDDLFPIEEVVRATIPLFVLPVLRLLDLAIGFVSPQEN